MRGVIRDRLYSFCLFEFALYDSKNSRIFESFDANSKGHEEYNIDYTPYVSLNLHNMTQKAAVHLSHMMQTQNDRGRRTYYGASSISLIFCHRTWPSCNLTTKLNFLYHYFPTHEPMNRFRVEPLPLPKESMSKSPWSASHQQLMQQLPSLSEYPPVKHHKQMDQYKTISSNPGLRSIISIDYIQLLPQLLEDGEC